MCGNGIYRKCYQGGSTTRSPSGGPAGTIAAPQAPTLQARVPGSTVQWDHIDPTQDCSSWFNNSTLTNTPPTNNSGTYTYRLAIAICLDCKLLLSFNSIALFYSVILCMEHGHLQLYYSYMLEKASEQHVAMHMTQFPDIVASPPSSGVDWY